MVGRFEMVLTTIYGFPHLVHGDHHKQRERERERERERGENVVGRFEHPPGV